MSSFKASNTQMQNGKNELRVQSPGKKLFNPGGGSWYTEMQKKMTGSRQEAMFEQNITEGWQKDKRESL